MKIGISCYVSDADIKRTLGWMLFPLNVLGYKFTWLSKSPFAMEQQVNEVDSTDVASKGVSGSDRSLDENSDGSSPLQITNVIRYLNVI